MYKYLETNKV